MKAFVIGCLLQIEAHYHELFKRRQEQSTTPPSPRESVKALSSSLDELSKELRVVKASLPKKAGRQVEIVRDLMAATSVKLGSVRKSLDDLASQATIYRGLATLGITSATFGHETAVALEGFLAAAYTAKALLDQEAEDEDPDAILDEIEKVIKYGERVSAWGAFALRRIRRDKRKRGRVDISALVSGLVKELDDIFKESTIDLVPHIEPVSGRVFPMEIESVLLNLLANAYYFVKRKEKKRRVDVYVNRAEREGAAGVELIVADSGPGVNPTLSSRVWDPLFSTKVDDAGRPDGTGLGLSIVDDIVRDMNGVRSVDRDTRLKGARFTVWLAFRT